MGKAFNLPIVLSTVNVKGGQKPTVPPLREVLSDQKEYDRATINAWEDKEFLEAVEVTRRKKLIMCALWTEACLIFPSLDALRDGYEVYPVVDAVGGTSLEAHQYALQRIALAGGKFVAGCNYCASFSGTGVEPTQSKPRDRSPLIHPHRSPKTYIDPSMSSEYPLPRRLTRQQKKRRYTLSWEFITRDPARKRPSSG